MDRIRLGRFGENIAEKYLKNHGFRIIERNYKIGWSAIDKIEVDIIAEESQTIHFIEVKTSQAAGNRGFFFPEDRANAAKRRKIAKAAQIWLSKNGGDRAWQEDIIAVSVSADKKTARIRHFQNVN